MSNYTFTCPDCDCHVIEEVMSGVTQTSSVSTIAYDKENNAVIVDYGEVSCEGGDPESIYYQCQQCGLEISIDTMYEIAKNAKKV